MEGDGGLISGKWWGARDLPTCTQPNSKQDAGETTEEEGEGMTQKEAPMGERVTSDGE